MTKVLGLVFAAGVALLGLAYGVVVARSACFWASRVCPGVRLEGRALSPNDDVDAWLGERAQALAAASLTVSVAGVPDASRTFALGDLGVVLDVGRTASIVRAIGHEGSLAARVAAARRAASDGVDVPILVNVDGESARAALMGLKDETDQLPIPARLDLAHGGVVPEVAGLFLDLDDAVEQVRLAALSGAATLELQRATAAPRVTREFLLSVDVHERLARFQTSFSRHGDQELRAHNIETAAGRLDGAVLLPHELFSFNAVVGPRTVENGFSKGWEIFKGEMVEGVGGGTCQAASTLHAAAFLSGLDVIERLPHSRPSAYITMGLDATVVYPVVDLKLRNPYDFPVVIHSYVDGNAVVFEILGRERPARVTFGREVLATRSYTRKVEEKPGLPADRIVRKQHGIRGYKIRRTRTIAYVDGTARREMNVDVYWPTVELYQVAPGTDTEGKLPPPGEGLDESGGSGWTALAEPASPVGGEVPGSSSPGASGPTAVAAAPAGAGAAAGGAVCTTDCAQPMASKIIEAPGVHAPRAEQLHAAPRVVISGGATGGDGPRKTSPPPAPSHP